jgi:hypothetical protein
MKSAWLPSRVLLNLSLVKELWSNYSNVNVASLEATPCAYCPSSYPLENIKFKSGTENENQSNHTIPTLLEQSMKACLNTSAVFFFSSEKRNVH